MRRPKRRLPIPQHEFGFTAEVFRLFSEHGFDGERLTRERAEAEESRRTAETAPKPLFAQTEKHHKQTERNAHDQNTRLA
jgi:hypothetical protein